MSLFQEYICINPLKTDGRHFIYDQLTSITNKKTVVQYFFSHSEAPVLELPDHFEG